MTAWMSSNFGQIPPLTPELSALERLKNICLVSSLLIGSSSVLQRTRITIKSWMSLKFDQIQQWTAELAALDQLKRSFTYLRTIQNMLMTFLLSVERSLIFGLLVVVVCVCFFFFFFFFFHFNSMLDKIPI